MKFTVNRLTLLKKLRDVQLAISTKTTIPILTGLKLEVTKSHYYSHIESRLNDYIRRFELLQEAHSNLLSAYVNSNKK